MVAFDLIPIKEAAKHVHMRHERLRDRCIRAGIARRWGGSEKRPRLRVKLAEVIAMLDADRFMPQAPQKHRRRGGKLNPLVQC